MIRKIKYNCTCWKIWKGGRFVSQQNFTHFIMIRTTKKECESLINQKTNQNIDSDSEPLLRVYNKLSNREEYRIINQIQKFKHKVN